jgi:putative DNA primase/helicase
MPQWLEEEIAEKKAPKGETNRATAGEDWEDERPRLIQLLAQLSPDFSHDEWATVLAVISYVSGGSKDGEDIAVEYSRGKYGSGHSGKFPGEAAVRRKYRSFRNDKRANAGMGTLVELAKGYGATVPKKRARKKYPDGARVELVVAQSVEEKAVRWVWKGFLARNKLHLLAGAGGTMKSTLTLAMAAVITRGGTWPDGTRCERPGNVVIWSGEDDLADTVKPRLRWAGADLSHVFFVQGVREEGQKRDFDPATDMPALERAFVQLGEVTLLIVDPIVTIVQKDNNSPSEVRRSLAPLIGLAWRFDCALLGLQHFTKGSKGADPTERILGSGAWVQAARLVLACARIEDGTGADGRMIFACIKSAYKAYGGFEYGFEEEARTEITRTAWGQAVKGIGSRIITEAEGDAQGGSKLASAKAWLREQLEGGMQSTVAVGLAALKAGFTEITLRRAREALGVRLLRKERKRWWGLREEE